jgi:uncharacterized protein (TIGR02391 family)
MSLQSLIPDAETFLALPPEELAFYVLQAAQDSSGSGGLLHIQGLHNQVGAYPGNKAPQIQVALEEAWQWLESQLLLVSAPGPNGRNGFRVLGRRAAGLRTAEQFKAFRQGVAFPKELLHPTIAERTWIAVMRGEFDAAVFHAFKAVEVAVREVGGFSPSDIGVDLMRKAFNPANGPLTRNSDPPAEREALMHLFAGAIGSYKNPHSHRNVVIDDASEAQEMVMLASHLLRIVDSRR